MKKNSVESVVKYFILIVVKVKERSERSQRSPFNSTEERQYSERSQWRKERSERSQMIDFNSGESKTV